MGRRKVTPWKLRDKPTYLGFVQSNIARMANCSCAAKAAFCALAAAVLALFHQDGPDCPWACPVVIVAIAAAFSAFDSGYLQLERRYRVLYKIIDEDRSGGYPTDMLPPPPNVVDGTRRRDAYLSWSVAGFYTVTAAICVAASLLLGM